MITQTIGLIVCCLVPRSGIAGDDWLVVCLLAAGLRSLALSLLLVYTYTLQALFLYECEREECQTFELRNVSNYMLAVLYSDVKLILSVPVHVCCQSYTMLLSLYVLCLSAYAVTRIFVLLLLCTQAHTI